MATKDPHQAYWDDLELDIDDPQTGYKKSLKGYKRILQYFQGEVNYWQPLASKISSANLNFLTGWIQSYLTQIIDLEKQAGDFPQGKKNVDTKFHALSVQINKAGKNANNQHYIHSKSEEAALIKSLVNYSPHAVDGAFKFYSNDPLPNTNAEMYVGYMQAAALEAGKRGIGDPASNQQVSFQEVRTDIENYKTEVEDWHTDRITVHSETQAKELKDYGVLKQVYEDHIALEGPAKYWRTRAKAYKKKGTAWMCGLIITTIVIVVVFGIGLYHPPEKIETDSLLSLENLRGILLLATIVSLSIYLIRVEARMTFSSFHIQRDAEEREQLTMVYLALIRRNAVSQQDDRNIILNALFSRSEFGILGDEGGPTMPGNQAINKLFGG